MAKIDWELLRTEYINDPTTSYKKLADKYGVNANGVYLRASEESWTALRKKYQIKLLQKVGESVSDKEVDDRVRLIRQAKFVAGRGLAGIATHPPRNARESKELWEAGTNLQAKILGFDKITNNTTNNTTIITIDTLVTQMHQRRQPDGR